MTTTRKPADAQTLKVGDKVYKGEGTAAWTILTIDDNEVQLVSAKATAGQTRNRGLGGNWIAIDTLTVEGE